MPSPLHEQRRPTRRLIPPSLVPPSWRKSQVGESTGSFPYRLVLSTRKSPSPLPFSSPVPLPTLPNQIKAPTPTGVNQNSNNNNKPNTGVPAASLVRPLRSFILSLAPSYPRAGDLTLLRARNPSSAPSRGATKVINSKTVSSTIDCMVTATKTTSGRRESNREERESLTFATSRVVANATKSEPALFLSSSRPRSGS